MRSIQIIQPCGQAELHRSKKLRAIGTPYGKRLLSARENMGAASDALAPYFRNLVAQDVFWMFAVIELAAEVFRIEDSQLVFTSEEISDLAGLPKPWWRLELSRTQIWGFTQAYPTHRPPCLSGSPCSLSFPMISRSRGMRPVHVCSLGTLGLIRIWPCDCLRKRWCYCLGQMMRVIQSTMGLLPCLEAACFQTHRFPRA